MTILQITVPDEIAEKIRTKCSEVGMTKSELVREAMRIAYGISEKDTESQKKEFYVYLKKNNYDYIYRCIYPKINKGNVEIPVIDAIS